MPNGQRDADQNHQHCIHFTLFQWLICNLKCKGNLFHLSALTAISILIRLCCVRSSQRKDASLLSTAVSCVIFLSSTMFLSESQR